MGNKKSQPVEEYNNESIGDLSIEFDFCWRTFIEHNCVIAKDKYVPMKTLIQAFTFYLENNPAFMGKFRYYNSHTYTPYNGVNHLVHVWIYENLKTLPDVKLSSGFNSVRDEVKYNRRNYFDYMYFVDERMVIGLSVERFQKA